MVMELLVVILIYKTARYKGNYLKSGSLPAKLNIIEEKVLVQVWDRNSIDKGKLSVIFSLTNAIIVIISIYKIFRIIYNNSINCGILF